MRTVAVVALVLALAGCGDEPKEPVPIAETRTATDKGDVVVRLLDQGAEPRRVLRYDLADWKGGNATVRTRMVMRTTFDGGDQRHAVEIPAMQVPVSYTPVGVDESGNLRVEFRIGRMELVDAEPQMAAAFEEKASVIAGMRGSSLITPGGCVLQSTIEVPERAPPMLKQLLEGLEGNLRRLSTPFPAQAVGAGARWDMSAPARMIGLAMDVRTTYRVEEITGTGVRIRCDVTSTGSGRPTVAGLGDRDAEFESVRTEGTMMLRLDLHDLIPAMESESRAAITLITADDERLEHEVEMWMEVAPAR